MSERERLEGLYAEMGDGELQALAGAPEELTDDGRAALEVEMRRRGLAAVAAAPVEEHGVVVSGLVAVDEEPEREQGFGAGIPGVIPTGAAAVEQALEPGGEERRGMARLISFYDGIELGRACEALEGAEVAFDIEEVPGEGMSGVPGHFAVWVEAGAQERAREVLREAMGLFPVAEVDPSGDDGDDEPLPEGDLVVAEFDTAAEAEEVRRQLTAEGFTAKVEGDRSDGDVSVVVVPASEQEGALAAVARRLGVE